MTARPLDPANRRMPVSAAVALMIMMVAVLLAAGCDAPPKENQDLHLVKLNHDGSVAWTKVIDSGKDDEMTDIIQTSDGGYILAGGYSKCNDTDQFPSIPVLTRLFPDGKIQWVQEYSMNGLIMEALGPPEKIRPCFPDRGWYPYHIRLWHDPAIGQ